MRTVLLSVLIEVVIGAGQLGSDEGLTMPVMGLHFRTKISSEFGGVAVATTEDLKHKMTPITGPVAGAFEEPDCTLAVDDSSSGERQRMDGFGAAWTDATVAVFDELAKIDQDSVLEDLFGESGIGLRFMRHTMGESDMSPKWIGVDGRWSYDENNGEPDPNMAHFDLTDNGKKMLSWLTRMFEKTTRYPTLGQPLVATWLDEEFNKPASGSVC